MVWLFPYLREFLIREISIPIKLSPLPSPEAVHCKVLDHPPWPFPSSVLFLLSDNMATFFSTFLFLMLGLLCYLWIVAFFLFSPKAFNAMDQGHQSQSSPRTFLALRIGPTYYHGLWKNKVPISQPFFCFLSDHMTFSHLLTHITLF